MGWHERFDGVDIEHVARLQDAITGLAFQGHPNPADEALRMLCDGEWIADAMWRWWAWDTTTYQDERRDKIPAERWKHLADGLERDCRLRRWSNGIGDLASFRQR